MDGRLERELLKRELIRIGNGRLKVLPVEPFWVREPAIAVGSKADYFLARRGEERLMLVRYLRTARLGLAECLYSLEVGRELAAEGGLELDLDWIEGS